MIARRAVLLAAPVLAAVLASVPASAGVPATTANDVCASNADPCNVTQKYDVTPNAVLDFGTRDVRVTGSGEFNFGSNSGKIECGDFSSTTTGPVITAGGVAAGGGTASGSVLVLSRRRCTNPVMACLDINDCELGPCGVRRCSKKSTKTCLADEDCQLGTCTALRRCSGSAVRVRCTTNADCDYGACPAQLTCTGRGDNPLNCSQDADCSFGSCTVGTASMTIDSPIAGNSDDPATIILRAADSVSISKLINLNSSSIESDGGSLAIDAEVGAITISNKINAVGGGTSSGGSIELNAGTDISITDDISVIGGDFDGGTVDLTAGRDITLTRSLVANSNSGAGFGGEIIIDAGRDLSFSGISTANKSTMEASGHTDVENTAGDGGTLELTAGRNISLDANTRLIGNGSAPDGSGSDMSIDAESGLVMNGNVTAKASGTQGSGGFLEVDVDGGLVSVGSTATFDLTGGASGGGWLDIDSFSGDLTFDGDADVSGGSGGSGGYAILSARQQASMAGSLFVDGGGGGSLAVDACRVSLSSGSSLDANGSGAGNTIVAHDIMQLLAGSSLTADGSNILRYRNPARPPVVQGTVTPSPTLQVDTTLSDCPLCGNRAIDPGESCDDGNENSGDGCSSACQNEKCIAQTGSPGYPNVPLCDDGDVCTDDVCNNTLAGGTCQHPPKNCDDSISCTLDTCDAGDGTCQHSTSDAMCDDDNDCTDDFCSQASGCSNTANSNPCDDNNRCTANDLCADKVCHGTRVSGCFYCGDEYVNVFANEQCDDGNTTNGDCCSSACRYEAASSPCEDGQFCTVGDTCDATGTCLTGVPNTCVDTDACTTDSCDEEAAACVNAEVPRDLSSCLVAPSAKLQIKNSPKPGKDKLQWLWNRGDSFSPTDIGTPGSSTGYTLCVYDTASSVSSLKASIDIAPSATLWNSADPSLVGYKDKSGASEGVLKAQLRSGLTGNTKVKISAGGAHLVLPPPAGASFFREEPRVVVQMINSEGMCWSSEFAPDDTKSNGPALFNAATK